MSTATSAPVAIVGLGAMGMGMARSLLRHGLIVRGYDVRADAGEALVAAGGMPAGSPAAAACGADVVIVMVVNAAQAEAVLLGTDGAVPVMAPGGVVVLSSTVPAAEA
jgi:L-threonate 2-dehydrogenase